MAALLHGCGVPAIASPCDPPPGPLLRSAARLHALRRGNGPRMMFAFFIAHVVRLARLRREEEARRSLWDTGDEGFSQGPRTITCSAWYKPRGYGLTVEEVRGDGISPASTSLDRVLTSAGGLSARTFTALVRWFMLVELGEMELEPVSASST